MRLWRGLSLLALIVITAGCSSAVEPTPSPSPSPTPRPSIFDSYYGSNYRPEADPYFSAVQDAGYQRTYSFEAGLIEAERVIGDIAWEALAPYRDDGISHLQRFPYCGHGIPLEHHLNALQSASSPDEAGPLIGLVAYHSAQLKLIYDTDSSNLYADDDHGELCASVSEGFASLFGVAGVSTYFR